MADGRLHDDALSTMTAELLQQLDEHVDRTVRRTLEAVPALRSHPGVSADDLWTRAREQLRSALVMLAERRGPDQPQIAWWRELGRRRAQQGVGLDDVMQALRIAHIVMWEIVTEGARRTGCAQEVVTEAALVWTNFDAASSEVGAGHQECGAQREVGVRRRSQVLLNALRGAAAANGETEGVARSLGLDPTRWFVALVHRGVGRPDPADAVVVEQPDRTVVITQHRDEPPQGELRLLRLARTGTRAAGIGIQRWGLAGAAQSLQDAEMAFRLAAALGDKVISFREHWLECLGLEHRDQQEALVADAVRRLNEDPAARGTVAAYVRNDGSLTLAARALGLHVNTVAYRLRQFADRTGVDVRTAEGIASVQVALTLSDVDRQGWDTDPVTEAAS